MRRFATRSALILIAACALGSATLAGAQDNWWNRSGVTRSKYYVVKSDLPQEQTAELARHMDMTCESYMKMFASLPVRVRRLAMLNLYLFAAERDYQETLAAKFKDDATGSWGKCITYGDNIWLVGWRGRYTVEEFKPLLQHEGFHQFASHLFPEMPPWANEGLAEVFERGVAVDRVLALGDVPKIHKARLISAFESGRIKPLDRFFTIGSREWSDDVVRGDASLNYLQAWSLVHFLLYAEDGKYQEGFLRFLVELNRFDNWQVAFIRAMGVPDFEALREKWEQHVRSFPATDYKGVVLRLDFLAAGMAKLREQEIYPASLEELRTHLQRIEFKHTAELFGETFELDARAPGLYEPPRPEEDAPPVVFRLIDPRGRTSGSRSKLPLDIVAAGHKPAELAVTWQKDGREYKPLIVARAPQTPADPGEAVADASDRPSDPAPADEPPDDGEDFRTWTSADGKFTTEARLITYVNGTAYLKRRDGETIKVPGEKLSEKDRAYLKAWKKR